MKDSSNDGDFMRLVQVALTSELDPSVYADALKLPELMDFEGAVAEKIYDSTSDDALDASGMRLAGGLERDLVFEFDDGLLIVEVSEHGILASAPVEWQGSEVRVETIRSITEATVDPDGMFEVADQRATPFRIIVMAGPEPRATRWILP